MSVNLKKGEKISLVKEGGGLKKVMVGLGWDEAQQTAKDEGDTVKRSPGMSDLTFDEWQKARAMSKKEYNEWTKAGQPSVKAWLKSH